MSIEDDGASHQHFGQHCQRGPGGAGPTAGLIVGTLCGLAFLAVSAVRGNRSYQDVWGRFRPLSPTPPAGD